MTAPLYPREADRLHALRSFAVLDTLPEATFDDVTRLVASVCEVPMALISLVDENRQWFKSAVGIGMRETSRDVSFCAHAILQPELLVIPDTLQDERFADNPLVRGEPYIRFYAGVPLRSAENLPLGTLCVLDTRPRQLDERQRDTLRLLARLVMTQLELRRSSAQQVELLSSISDAFYGLDRDWRFTYVNAKAEALWQRSRETLIGRVIWDVFPQAVGTPGHQAHLDAAAERRPISLEMVSPVLNVPVEIKIYPHPSGLSVSFCDISERKRIEEERTAAFARKEAMLKEVNHRMKNSLQLMSSMLRLQARQIQDPDLRRQFEAAGGRASTVALVHERLYRTEVTDRLEFGRYLRDICGELERTLNAAGRPCAIRVDTDMVELRTDQVIPLGLVVNELVTNAVKYAYPDGSDARVTVALQAPQGGDVTLAVTDSGIGLAEGSDPAAANGLGMRLVNALVSQVGGKLAIGGNDPGTRVVVTLPR
jgi:two-component sensor histidine kinase